MKHHVTEIFIMQPLNVFVKIQVCIHIIINIIIWNYVATFDIYNLHERKKIYIILLSLNYISSL